MAKFSFIEKKLTKKEKEKEKNNYIFLTSRKENKKDKKDKKINS